MGTVADRHCRARLQLLIVLLPLALAVSSCGGGGSAGVGTSNSQPVTPSPAPAPDPKPSPTPPPSPDPSPTPVPTEPFQQPPPSSADALLWVRKFAGLPTKPSTVTSVILYDSSISLTQYLWESQFTAKAGFDTTILQIGPVLAQGAFVSPVTTLQTLKAGMTQQAIFPYSISNAGALDVAECRVANGAYFVSEVAYTPDGKLAALAADFSAACSSGLMKNVTGALRYHSTIPSLISKTFAVQGVDHAVTEGDVVTLDGTLSWNPGSRIASIVWQQISGPAFDLSACSGGVCSTYAPQVAPGGAAAVFRLTATSESGVTATGDLTLKVRSWQDKQWRMDVFGAGFVAAGSELSYTEADGPFEVPIKDGTDAVYPSQTIERVEIRHHGNATYGSAPMVSPQVAMSNTAGLPLTAGHYSGSLRAGFTPFSTGPSFDFIFNGRGCNSLVWDAEIAALDRHADDLTKIDRAAMWFSEQCTDAGLEPNPSYVRVWINYTPQLPPTARANAPTTAVAGQPVTITDSGSLTPAGSMLLRSYRQVFGTPVQNMVMQRDGSLVLVPSTTTPDGASIVIAYEVTDSLGQSGVTLLPIVVKGGKASSGSVLNVQPRSAHRVVLLRANETSSHAMK